MLILGIDPGSRLTGYGLVQYSQRKLFYVASGCIRCNVLHSFANRLGQIFENISILIKEYSPEETAIEQIFMHRNPTAALKLGQARGAAICAIIQKGLPLAEYSAKQIKQAVSAYGSASKLQIQYMVKKLLNLSGDIQTDAADALAVAICHAHRL